MGTESTPNNNEHIPKIWERDEIIILSHDKECKCGRAQDRPHCPSCGSIQTYAKAQTRIAKLTNGDVMKGCRIFRCLVCGTRYNDLEWYFGCHARPEIDWVATRKRMKEKEARANMEWWKDRIIAMWHAGQEIKADHNELQRFRAQVGGSFEEFARSMISIEVEKENQKLREEIERLKGDNNEKA